MWLNRFKQNNTKIQIIVLLFFFQVYAINDLNMTGEKSTETKKAPAGGI